LHVSLTIPLSSYLAGLSQVPHGYNDPDVDGPGCMLTSFDSVIRNIEKYVRVTFGPFLEHRPLKRLWFVITLTTTYSWSVGHSWLFTIIHLCISSLLLTDVCLMMKPWIRMVRISPVVNDAIDVYLRCMSKQRFWRWQVDVLCFPSIWCWVRCLCI
jgi:hypothetical protein